MNSQKARKIKSWCLEQQKKAPQLFIKPGAFRRFYRRVKSQYKGRRDVKELINNYND